VQEARQLARTEDLSGECTHSGMIASWMKIMADPGLVQNRLEWVTDDLRLSEDSELIYFPGCLPYYEIAFDQLGAESLEIARSAVKILNALGIEPIVMANERCCGHDPYWQGDLETFQALAALNIEAIRETGAKKLVTTCPECAYTLKYTYAEEAESLGLEVMHLTEFLAAEEKFSGALSGNHDPGGPVTYQDACRLGRYQGVYQEPRSLIDQLGFQLVEMDHHQHSSLCCGTSCWSTCGQMNKKIQVERLKEARATGAERLITSCVKCQIHFKCAQKDPALGSELEIEIRDLTTLLAENLLIEQ
jgi:Fe-S oxidoreductase